MELAEPILAAGEFVMREAALFAACGFLLLGASDLMVDLIWVGIRLKRRGGIGRADALPPPARPGRLAIFVPAWDEAEVIGAMLAHAEAAFGNADYLLYVGCYPNDPATIAAVRAAGGPRVRLVIGPAPGPTSKADCLNRIWERMIEDERQGLTVKAIVLHDAEDVVHSAEPALFDSLIERFDLVQLPVLPLIDPESRWIGGSYVDSFAESHGKDLVVRAAIGASLPSAGVGCAISRDALAALAEARGTPFDPDSLTEDYELGLRLRTSGRAAAFIRLAAGAGSPLVSTRAYFPGTLDSAVAQKGRWVAGIALAGWDRLGWNGGVAERWMRLRDRQSVIAAVLLCAAYLALALWGILRAVELIAGRANAPIPDFLALLLAVNTGILAWRLSMRAGFVAQAYGWREGLRSMPRVMVANLVDMLAVRRALVRYLSILRTGRAAWEKTPHAFPHQLPAE